GWFRTGHLLLKPERARRACLCGTHGDLPLNFHPVAGQWGSTKMVSPDLMSDEILGKPAANTILEDPCRETEVAGKTAERGAERCHLKLTYEAAFSAPSVQRKLR